MPPQNDSLVHSVTADASAPSRVVVAVEAIRGNAALLREECATPIMAVVKADGFALGADVVARAALEGGATELGVATCDEALALRAAGVTAPILAWMLHPAAPVAAALAADVSVSCASLAQVRDVVAAARRVGVRARIELECETGMNRSGCPASDWSALCEEAARAEEDGLIEVVGVWTHLGVTGTDAAAVEGPLARLADAATTAEAAGLRPARRHAASSLAATIAPRSRLDLVRTGAALLGIEPVPDRPLGLAPVFRWTTTVAQVREVAPGESVGYGGRHTVSRPGRLALLPVGYADGVPRAGWPGLEVSIGGRRHPLVGAVSMDQCVVDIGSAPVAAGDEVVLIGDAAAGEPTLAAWAETLGTIAQEVMTRLGPRVARVVDERTEVGA